MYRAPSTFYLSTAVGDAYGDKRGRFSAPPHPVTALPTKASSYSVPPTTSAAFDNLPLAGPQLQEYEEQLARHPHVSNQRPALWTESAPRIPGRA